MYPSQRKEIANFKAGTSPGAWRCIDPLKQNKPFGRCQRTPHTSAAENELLVLR